MLLATAVAAQGALGLIYLARARARRSRGAGRSLFWLAQAAAILVKGPVVPALSVLTMLAVSVADRDGRWLKGLRACGACRLLLVVVGPWLYRDQSRHRRRFPAESVGHDLSRQADRRRGGAWRAAADASPVLLAVILAGAVFPRPHRRAAWRERRAVAARFLIAWAVPFWILIELVPTKLPQYLLPAYPALALMAGRALLAADPKWRRYDLPFAAIWGIVALCLMAGLIETPVRFGAGLDPAGIGAAVVLAIFGVALLWTRAPAVAICCSLVIYIPLAQFVAPRLDRLFPSSEIAAQVHDRPVAVAGYSEPSLVFLLGTGTQLLSPEAAAAALAQHQVAAAIVSQTQETAFRQALDGAAKPAASVSGLDYSTGKPVTLTLFRSPFAEIILFSLRKQGPRTRDVRRLSIPAFAGMTRRNRPLSLLQLTVAAAPAAPRRNRAAASANPASPPRRRR